MFALALVNVKYAAVAEIWNAALTLATDAVITTHIVDIYDEFWMWSAKLIKDAIGAEINERNDDVSLCLWDEDLKAYSSSDHNVDIYEACAMFIATLILEATGAEIDELNDNVNWDWKHKGK